MLLLFERASSSFYGPFSFHPPDNPPISQERTLAKMVLHGVPHTASTKIKCGYLAVPRRECCVLFLVGRVERWKCFSTSGLPVFLVAGWLIPRD